MTRIIREVLIKAPVAKVWAALADFGNVSHMSPTIIKSHLTSKQNSGVGMTRHCDLSMMGGTLEERVTLWDEEGYQMGVVIDDWTKMPGIKSMDANYTLKAEGELTRMRAVMQYEVGLGFIGDLMNTLMLKPMNSRNWDNFVAGIRLFVESGLKISNVTLLRTSDLTTIVE